MEKMESNGKHVASLREIARCLDKRRDTYRESIYTSIDSRYYDAQLDLNSNHFIRIRFGDRIRIRIEQKFLSLSCFQELDYYFVDKMVFRRW